MKYQVGDTVAFNVPISPNAGPRGARADRQRFNVGLIKAVLEEQQAYQIAALVGKAYLVREAEINGRAEIRQPTYNWKSDSY
jgi:hypothetical protein